MTQLIICTDLLTILDFDKNGLLNAYELETAIAIPDRDVPIRYFQLNCSLCANNVKDYYMPWKWK